MIDIESFFNKENKHKISEISNIIWYPSNIVEKQGLIHSFYQLITFLKKDCYKGRCQDPLSLEKYYSEY